MEEGFVGWKMSKTELVVVHGEVPRSESLIVLLGPEADGASTPTRVDELPFAVVDLDGVPGMGAVFSWDWLTRLEGGEAGTFAMTTDDEGLKTGVGSDGGEEASVAFADGKASCKGVGRSRRFNRMVAERNDVVGDVVVKPSKYDTSLVGRGCEGSYELVC